MYLIIATLRVMQVWQTLYILTNIIYIFREREREREREMNCLYIMYIISSFPKRYLSFCDSTTFKRNCLFLIDFSLYFKKHVCRSFSEVLLLGFQLMTLFLEFLDSQLLKITSYCSGLKQRCCFFYEDISKTSKGP